MMYRLYKVLDIWQNLEQNYEKSKINLTRRQYLEKLLAFNTQIDSPIQLKSMLQEESSKYTDDQYKDYRSLIEVLDCTYTKLLNDNSVILNLDSFVYSNSISVVDIDDTAVFKTVNSITEIKDVLEAGYLLETVDVQSDNIRSFITGSEQPGYVAIRNQNEMISFLSKTKSDIENSEFLKQVYYILGNYVMSKKLVYPTVFISSTYFSLSDDERYLNIGSRNIKVTKSNLNEATDKNITLLSKERIHLDKVLYYSKPLDEADYKIRLNCVVC